MTALLKKTKFRVLLAAVAICVLLGLYAGAYVALVRTKDDFEFSPEGILLKTPVVDYEWSAGDPDEKHEFPVRLFAAAHWFDRRWVRPRFWGPSAVEFVRPTVHSD